MLPARLIDRLSLALIAIDKLIMMTLIAAIAALVLTNVFTRMVGVTIAWIDELAVLCMIMAGFVGASLMLRFRMDPAVTLLHDALGTKATRVLKVIVAVLALGFGIALLWMCWRWFNLPGLIAAGFDVRTFEGQTFNFIYTEVTPVMQLPSVIFFAIVPWFALTLSVHALANLLEEVGLLERRALAPAGDVGEG